MGDVERFELIFSLIANQTYFLNVAFAFLKLN